jgi:hypothetical protein
MRILLDNCMPRGILAALRSHDVVECRSRGWDRLKNGDLLNAAEAAGFELLVTADQSISAQQNLTTRRIAIVALGTNRWRLVRRHLKQIIAAVEKAQPGSVTSIPISDE